MITAFQRLHLAPTAEWHREDIAALKPLFTEQHLDWLGNPLPLLTNASDLISGARNWIRGFHAALYGQYLSPEQAGMVLGPLPGFFHGSKRPPEQQLAQFADLSNLILRILRGAERADAWDGIEAWGGAIRYRCIWHRTRSRQPPRMLRAFPAICYWMLLIPGVLDIAATVQHPVPWRGWYYFHDIPEGASRLSDEILRRG